jgi:hypothetical protein
MPTHEHTWEFPLPFYHATVTSGPPASGQQERNPLTEILFVQDEICKFPLVLFDLTTVGRVGSFGVKRARNPIGFKFFDHM